MSPTYIRPDVRAFLDAIKQTPLADLGALGVQETRALMEQIRATRPAARHELALVRDLDCDGPAGRIGLRFYDARPERSEGPALVYFHGGGFVLGDLNSHHDLCVEIAHAVDLPVISVDYRLAPENPWPAAPDDAEAAVRWVARHAGEVLERDITSLVLAGDSAGGNLAAVTAAALRDAPTSVPVAAQFLIYPTVGVSDAGRSGEAFADGYFLTRKTIDWFNANYAAPPQNSRYDLLAAGPAAMPPTLLVTAGLDPLRDEGRAYAAALVEAGVPVSYQEMAGNIHGCFGMRAAIPSTARDMARAFDALRLLIADIPLSEHRRAGMDTVLADGLAHTPSGIVRGEAIDAAWRFLGIPYAAPPVGALRFALPQRPDAWEGVREATTRGAIAPQPTPTPAEMERVMPGIDLQPLIGDDQIQGDDYMLLNIWAPQGAANAPVMVFVHGGGFFSGAGAADVYDGAAFARAGVVCVSINYRLGIEGFLPIPGAPTNLGLRDQIFALEWVREAIAGFGGDPANVTVFGESAGGMAIANLVVSPLAKGLFKRAIIQSGHGDMVRPVDVAQRLTRKVAKILRVRPTLEGFKSSSIKDCLAALRKVSLPTAGVNLRNADGREPAFGLIRFLPVHGDDVLPEHPMQALERGAGAEVQLIVGTNSEEANLYFVPSGAKKWIGRFLANWIVKRSEPRARDVLRSYGIREKGRRAGDVFVETLTDLIFRLPARRFAAAHRGSTHVYDFGWRSTAYNGRLGACHAIELPFVFNTLSTVTGPRGFAGEHPPQALADHMNRLWVEFATSGTLPWCEYTSENRIVYHPETGEAALERPLPAEAVLG